MPRTTDIELPRNPRAARIARACLLAFAALAAIHGCASDKVAGTSSGVDNPALTVSFRDADNSAARVTGDLDVYALDQNPAVDPQPLATIAVRNASFTSVTASDFARAAGSAAAPALSKRAAAVTDFNLVLKTLDKNGGFIMGLRYDPAAKAFRRRDGAGLDSIEVIPRPLIRYEARIARDAVHGDAGRIFVPGSPFLATLADSVFVIEDVPEGFFPLRMLAADGKVYPIGDSLNTADPLRIYRPGKTPIGSLDTIDPVDTIPDFSLKTSGSRTVFLGEPVVLEAALVGIAANDPRVSILWHWLKDSLGVKPIGTDTTRPPKDTLAGPVAKLLTPTSLRTEVRFSGEGVFRFIVTANAGMKSALDSLTIVVRAAPRPIPRIIRPRPADSLMIGKPYDIQWDMPGKGPFSIEVTLDKGLKWIPIVEKYDLKDSLQTYRWTPSAPLDTSSRCLIRVTDLANPAQVANMEGVFHLVP